MIIGIVGSEEAKFTFNGAAEAKSIIRGLVLRPDTTKVVSGRCHLGGIDLWAAEIARDNHIEVEEFPPKVLAWEGGYKQRNLEIARASDAVYCITVDALPPDFPGMKFLECYHCHTNDHVKSGGCWTLKQALRMGKQGRVYVVHN
jgi:hypothetical protein